MTTSDDKLVWDALEDDIAHRFSGATKISNISVPNSNKKSTLPATDISYIPTSVSLKQYHFHDAGFILMGFEPVYACLINVTPSKAIEMIRSAGDMYKVGNYLITQDAEVIVPLYIFASIDDAVRSLPVTAMARIHNTFTSLGLLAYHQQESIIEPIRDPSYPIIIGKLGKLRHIFPHIESLSHNIFQFIDEINISGIGLIIDVVDADEGGEQIGVQAYATIRDMYMRNKFDMDTLTPEIFRDPYDGTTRLRKEISQIYHYDISEKEFYGEYYVP